MNPTPKLIIHAALAAGRPADRALRVPRLEPSLNVRAAFPAVMGNRAFIRAWAARRAKSTAHSAN